MRLTLCRVLAEGSKQKGYALMLLPSVQDFLSSFILDLLHTRDSSWLNTWAGLRRYSYDIYTSPIAAIASAHSVLQQQYADDTQLYIALSLNDSSTSIHNLESCLRHLYYWCCLNGLAVNPDETGCILFDTRQRANSNMDITVVNVADTTTTLKEKI